MSDRPYQERCKHNGQFLFRINPYRFACQCGYSLNFDPSQFTDPYDPETRNKGGIAYVDLSDQQGKTITFATEEGLGKKG